MLRKHSPISRDTHFNLCSSINKSSLVECVGIFIVNFSANFFVIVFNIYIYNTYIISSNFCLSIAQSWPIMHINMMYRQLDILMCNEYRCSHAHRKNSGTVRENLDNEYRCRVSIWLNEVEMQHCKWEDDCNMEGLFRALSYYMVFSVLKTYPIASLHQQVNRYLTVTSGFAARITVRNTTILCEPSGK